MKTTLAIVFLLNAQGQPVRPAQIYPFAMTHAECEAMAKRSNHDPNDTMTAIWRRKDQKVQDTAVGCTDLEPKDAATLKQTLGQ